MAKADNCCGILARPPLLWFLPETRLLLCSGVKALLSMPGLCLELLRGVLA